MGYPLHNIIDAFISLSVGCVDQTDNPNTDLLINETINIESTPEPLLEPELVKITAVKRMY